MMEQVNLSRLSHGVRAAAMMRRCVNEAMIVSADAHRLWRDHRQLSPAAPPAFETHGADRAGAVDDAVCRKLDGPGQCRVHRRAKPAPHPHAAAEIPRLPRQHSGRDRRRWKYAAATVTSRSGCMPAWCATRTSGCSGKAPATSMRSISSSARSEKAAAHRILGAALKRRLDEAASLPKAFGIA